MMITLNNFKEEMNWNTGTWTNEQLETIYNSVNATNFVSLDELEKEYSENTEHDTDTIVDVNLVYLIDTLAHNGLSEHDIADTVSSPYGSIDLYYVENDNTYVMLMS